MNEPNTQHHNEHNTLSPPTQGDEAGTQPPELDGNIRPTTQQLELGQLNRNHIRNKRANINIVALNINRAKAPTAKLNFTDKWMRINSTIRENKIAISAIQETHLNNKGVEIIEWCFGKSFKLLYLSDPISPTMKAGVAIIINKALIPMDNIKLHVLACNRLLGVVIGWTDVSSGTGHWWDHVLACSCCTDWLMSSLWLDDHFLFALDAILMWWYDIIG